MTGQLEEHVVERRPVQGEIAHGDVGGIESPDEVHRALVAKLELRARLVVEGFVTGMHKSPYRGFAIEFAQHREYTPGDDLRHLDWKVLGRTDRYFVNADGEMMFVPQQGEVRLLAELGWLSVRPGEIAVVPRGMKFRVEVDGPVRGYLCGIAMEGPLVIILDDLHAADQSSPAADRP